MKYYVEENVSQRSCTTIRHVIKMVGSVSETLIFFFLGVVTITTDHEWNWGYIIFSLLFTLLWRGLGLGFSCKDAVMLHWNKSKILYHKLQKFFKLTKIINECSGFKHKSKISHKSVLVLVVF